MISEDLYYKFLNKKKIPRKLKKKIKKSFYKLPLGRIMILKGLSSLEPLINRLYGKSADNFPLPGFNKEFLNK